MSGQERAAGPSPPAPCRPGRAVPERCCGAPVTLVQAGTQADVTWFATFRSLPLSHMRLLLLLLLTLTPSLVAQTPAPPVFTSVLASGPFGLPAEARSVDWSLVNEAPDTQVVRVTIWQLNLLGPKSKSSSGAVVLRLAPGGTIHDANPVGPSRSFRAGTYYEVIVEVRDRRVLPAVEIWSDNQGTAIAGTRIGPTDFRDLLP